MQQNNDVPPEPLVEWAVLKAAWESSEPWPWPNPHYRPPRIPLDAAALKAESEQRRADLNNERMSDTVYQQGREFCWRAWDEMESAPGTVPKRPSWAVKVTDMDSDTIREHFLSDRLAWSRDDLRQAFNAIIAFCELRLSAPSEKTISTTELASLLGHGNEKRVQNMIAQSKQTGDPAPNPMAPGTFPRGEMLAWAGRTWPKKKALLPQV